MSRKTWADFTPGAFSKTTMRPGYSTRNSLPVSSPAWVSRTILSNSMPGKAGSSSTGARGRASTGGGSSRTGVGVGSIGSAAVGEGSATGTSSCWGCVGGGAGRVGEGSAAGDGGSVGVCAQAGSRNAASATRERARGRGNTAVMDNL